LDRYSSLHRVEREAVLDAYGELDLTSSSPNHLAQTALNLWRSNRHEEALICYTRAIEEAPADSTLLLNRGNLHFELGNISAAVADFDHAAAANSYKRATEFEPRQKHLWALPSEQYHKLGQEDLSREAMAR
jgi:tetratricopeptide (TPR) repeat protein